VFSRISIGFSPLILDTLARWVVDFTRTATAWTNRVVPTISHLDAAIARGVRSLRNSANRRFLSFGLLSIDGERVILLESCRPQDERLSQPLHGGI